MAPVYMFSQGYKTFEIPLTRCTWTKVDIPSTVSKPSNKNVWLLTILKFSQYFAEEVII